MLDLPESFLAARPTLKELNDIQVARHDFGPGGMVRTFADVSDSVQVNADLQESEQRWKLALRAAGIGVSLDDFGTGYSSLSYLQKFNIDVIKIDLSFVRHLAPASTNLALCKAIIVMAHALGIQVMAAGVETAQQRDRLAAAGCDFAQGYLFARPMAAADFDVFMAAR